MALFLSACGEKSQQYAPLTTAKSAATVWVQAINAEDWAKVCEISVVPRNGCEDTVEEIFSECAGHVKVQGPSRTGRRETVFTLDNAPEAVDPIVERYKRSYRVHFEYAFTEEPIPPCKQD